VEKFYRDSDKGSPSYRPRIRAEDSHSDGTDSDTSCVPIASTGTQMKVRLHVDHDDGGVLPAVTEGAGPRCYYYYY